MNNIVCVQDFENHANKVLPKPTLYYCNGGASSEQTLRLNRTAFSDLRLRPKFMRNVAKRDLSVTIMGKKMRMPIGISPSGSQKVVHPEGECATVRAAQEKDVVFILSTFSNSSIEEIAKQAPNATKWFQLYVYKDREISKQHILRAEKAGFEAIVLTVDLPVIGLRFSEIRSKFTLPPYLSLDNFHKGFGQNVKTNITADMSKFLDSSLTWRDIEWIKGITKLPIFVKGVLTAEDAIEAADMGVAGIIVSNHGGRQLDSVPAPIEALPEIVKAVGSRVDVFIDGGFREGVDVFKALALGAKMVFLGRPVIWSLSYDGQKGVEKLLDILENELDNTLALMGCTSVNDICANMVVHKSYYSRL